MEEKVTTAELAEGLEEHERRTFNFQRTRHRSPNTTEANALANPPHCTTCTCTHEGADDNPRQQQSSKSKFNDISQFRHDSKLRNNLELHNVDGNRSHRWPQRHVQFTDDRDVIPDIPPPHSPARPERYQQPHVTEESEESDCAEEDKHSRAPAPQTPSHIAQNASGSCLEFEDGTRVYQDKETNIYYMVRGTGARQPKRKPTVPPRPLPTSKKRGSFLLNDGRGALFGPPMSHQEALQAAEDPKHREKLELFGAPTLRRAYEDAHPSSAPPSVKRQRTTATTYQPPETPQTQTRTSRPTSQPSSPTSAQMTPGELKRHLGLHKNPRYPFIRKVDNAPDIKRNEVPMQQDKVEGDESSEEDVEI